MGDNELTEDELWYEKQEKSLKNILEWQDTTRYKPEHLEKRTITLRSIFNGTSALRKMFKHKDKHKFFENLYYLIRFLNHLDNLYPWQEAGKIMMERGIPLCEHLTKPPKSKDPSIPTPPGRIVQNQYVICKPIDYKKLGANIDINETTLAYYLREMERVGFIKKIYGGTGQHGALYAIGYVNNGRYEYKGQLLPSHSIHYFLEKNKTCMEAIEHFDPYSNRKKQ